MIEPILKVIGARKLRELSAADVRQALSTMAAEYCSSAVTMGHLALKRTIRRAEANDLVSRNVATLVDTPKGFEACLPGLDGTHGAEDQLLAKLINRGGSGQHGWIGWRG